MVSKKKTRSKKRSSKKVVRKAKARVKKKPPKRKVSKARKPVKKKVRAKRPTPKKKPKVRAKKLAKKAKAPKLKAKIKVAPKKVEKEVVKIDTKKLTGILGDAYIRQSLIELGGENALAIIRNFYGNHSDEDLAKRLKIKISDVRATLNKLHNEGLVNYSRQKDSETGWYSYSWTLNQDRIEKWAGDQTKKLGLDEDETEERYFCPSCGASTISSFEDASVENFRCSQCNRMLELLDRNKMLEIYERRRWQ